jgi:NADH-quinone oxidoreductase subunit A
MNPYVALSLYLAAVLAFVALTLALNRLLGPKPGPAGAKLDPFECGAMPIEAIGERALSVKYYGIAIVFVLFDLETVFFYLWALGAQPLTGAALAAFAVFVTLLALIMLYVWRSGLLEEITR